MATINFLAGESFVVNDLAGSGLGFYGPGAFGSSVRVGEYQDNTYITDATGAVQGLKVDNCKYAGHPNSGELAGSNVRNLRDIPNYLATLEIRFSHPTPVKVQNAKFTYFNGTNVNLPPSGGIFKVAELVHPWNDFTGLGSGSVSWKTPGGSGGLINGYTYDVPMTLAGSPGSGGWSPNGPNGTMDTQHSWYLVCSATPSVAGSSQASGFFQAEYL